MSEILYSGRDNTYRLDDGQLVIDGPTTSITLTPTDVNTLLHLPTESGTERQLTNGWVVVTKHPWVDIMVTNSEYIFTNVESLEIALQKMETGGLE